MHMCACVGGWARNAVVSVSVWAGRLLTAVCLRACVHACMRACVDLPTFGIDTLCVYFGQGRDFAGQDYNVTMWHSPSSEAANHYEAAALRCEKYCLDDPKCCSWTYCPAGNDQDPERCCLKSKVPAEVSVACLRQSQGSFLFQC